MGLLSPTVLRVTTIVLILGTISFVVAGFVGQGSEQTTGSVLLSGVVIGGPISAILGVITGLVWEKLFGPIKSVEHLDMRKRHYKSGRERAKSMAPGPDLRDDDDDSRDLARAREPASDRRYTGKGGGRRRR